MKKIAWIGTGVMGCAMARHLLDGGYEVHVFTRTPSKAQSLIDNGAIWHNDLASCVNEVEIVYTMVGYPKDVEEVYLGNKGILHNVNPNTICVDMTTSSPQLAKRLYDEGQLRHISVLDAPVSGGDIGARNGTLAIMVGGDKDAFENVFPLFQLLGKNIRHLGPASFGQHTKMANQIAVAGAIAATTEAILYAQNAGLDLPSTLEVLSSGAAGSWQLSNNGPKILKEDVAPGFYIHHFVKDMNLVLDEAKAFDIDLPVLSTVLERYQRLVKQGDGSLGTQALYKTYTKK